MNSIISKRVIRSEKGFVLVTSLLILMVITLLGVTGLSSATMEGKMAHNMQHSMHAFQLAESLIEDTIRTGNPKDAIYVQGNDPYLNAYIQGVGQQVNITPPMAEYAQAIGGNAASPISTTGSNVTQTGLAAKLCPDFTVGTFKCVPYEINAVATINSSNATVNNIQGIDHLVPGGS